MGHFSNTHPRGALLSPINPLSVTLGITNASFVAQTVDWNPAHLYATIKAGFKHEGLAFIRILQRCPHYVPVLWNAFQNDPSRLLLLNHPDGIQISDGVSRLFPNQQEHDPKDLSTAKELVLREDAVPVGLLYHNENAERYDHASIEGLGMSAGEKIEGINAALDRFQI